MSGGFFRGTSSEQDTRFSNKQAKLLKSQKFAPELEHLVDMTKVKMDVIRPWIANRVTELLGFEDEVLINFIYGLLDVKEVNGKEVQISLTGFMEKNTVKFMKELWALLLSAQVNASGVPQQFLDAKEEETRKKKVEADRIVNEIQKNKEKESGEFEQERLRKMDNGVESNVNNADLDPTSEHLLQRSSSVRSGDDKETNRRNGFGGRSRASHSRSTSKSLSRSRSYSSDRHRSRSISRSPATRGRSMSSERIFHSHRRRSIPTRRRHSPSVSLSPPRRSSYSRRRSRSRSHRRALSPEWRRVHSPYRYISPSPVRHRLSSPVRRRRSPTPMRYRRSPSPVRRRTPSNVRRRSPMPVRRRSYSPLHRGSPSPVWRGSPSPNRRRSPPPARRRSPIPTRYRSPSPVQGRSTSVRNRHWRSPLTPLRRSPSLVRNRSAVPVRRKSPGPSRRRSPTPYESSSPSPIQNRSRSPIRRLPVDNKRSTKESPREKIRTMMKSPEKDPKAHSNLGSEAVTSSSSPEAGYRRSTPYESARRKITEQVVHDDRSGLHRQREQKPRHESPSTSDEEENNSRGDIDLKSKSQHKVSSHASDVCKRIDSPVKVHDNEEYSPKRLAGLRVLDKTESRKGEQEKKGEKSSGKAVFSETSDHQEDKHRVSILKEDQGVQHHKSQTLLIEKAEKNERNVSYESGSDDSGKHIIEKKDKRKHKRSERRHMASDDDYSSDSYIEDRKEVKRRRKEEKKLRKEEKRRRREERRQRREQRRAEKLKAKNQSDADSSGGEYVQRSASRRSDDEGSESKQKKLEIELRNKALESLKAKKGIGH